MTMNRRAFSAGLVASASAFAFPARASIKFPERPIRLFNGFAAGGPTDIVNRICADYLSKSLGHPVLAETKTGGTGIIAGQEVAKAAPDGHTLLMSPSGPMVTAFPMNPKLPINPAEAFETVTAVLRFPQILEVSSKLPVKTYEEFVDYARKNSGKLRHGSAGVGGGMHLVSEMLQERLGFKSNHIPYRGTAPFTQGMMQGEIDWGVDVPGGSTPLSAGGFVRLLAVTTEKRSTIFPDIPSLTELGMKDAVWPNYFVLVGPKGLPDELCQRLWKEFAQVWTVADNVERLKPLGLEVWSAPPDESREFLAQERARWGGLIERLKLSKTD